MYEVFPVVAGAVLALIVPRFVTGEQRKWVYAFAGVVVAALATIVAGEEWFFIFIDLAEVLGAILVTSMAINYNRERQRNTAGQP